MKYAAAIAAAAFVAGASATNYTTEVVTAYTTYCPGPTTLTHGGKTYPVTEATTLTITDCPCTVTKPVYTTKPIVAPYPTANGTVPHPGPTAPAGSPPAGSLPAGSAPAPSATGSTPAPSAGAASALSASGAALAGFAAIAAFLF